MLNNNEPKFWQPMPVINTWLMAQIAQDWRVLEIGPGTMPFPRADVYVDFQDSPTPEAKVVIGDKPFMKIDVGTQSLPFADNEFDFVFCRHVVEDMFNPFLLCSEMSRVAKHGYLEAPSPIAEMCRGIDGNSPSYRGYHHHRFIVWVDNEGVLNFVSKYPIIEYMPFVRDQEDEALLRAGPLYWNTYLGWSDEIRVKHWQNPLDFMMPHEYPTLLDVASRQARISIDKVWQSINGTQKGPPPT